MNKTALITGITGQDGSYLAEHLLECGYEVHGTIRPSAGAELSSRLWRIEHLLGKIHLHSASLESYESLASVVRKVVPNEVYHLAAQSFVSESFNNEFTTMDVNLGGTHRLLSAVLTHAPEARFYFAGTSEQFGGMSATPQCEATQFHPRSPYAVAKTAGYHLTRNYREARKLYACSGILFNHESPRRGQEFVTRKITMGVASIVCGNRKPISLGNLCAHRDWGFAGDYVKAMHLMLQQEQPEDFVVATGQTRTVYEFAQAAFRSAGIEEWKAHIIEDERYKRPAEVDYLCGDSGKARNLLRWKPEVSFEQLVEMMVKEDINRCRLMNSYR